VRRRDLCARSEPLARQLTTKPRYNLQALQHHVSMKKVGSLPTAHNREHRILTVLQLTSHRHGNRSLGRDENLLSEHTDSVADHEATSGRKRAPDRLAPTVNALCEYQHVEALCQDPGLIFEKDAVFTRLVGLGYEGGASNTCRIMSNSSRLPLVCHETRTVRQGAAFEKPISPSDCAACRPCNPVRAIYLL